MLNNFWVCTADEDCHLQAARVGSDVSQAYTVSFDCRAVSSACSSSCGDLPIVCPFSGGNTVSFSTAAQAVASYTASVTLKTIQ